MLLSNRLVTSLGLFFVSGATALIYQILWMRELSLLFGATAPAAAAALTAFFLGLTVGNWYWGRRSERFDRPLRAYGVLEWGVAGASVAYFAIIALYQPIYSALFISFQDVPFVFTLIKFVLAVALLFPASFFMGGTLPVLSRYVVAIESQLGVRVSILYASNTVGAATGAFLAGFVLPRLFGFDTAYLLNILLTGAVGLVAWVVGGAVTRSGTRATETAPPGDEQVTPTWRWPTLAVLASVSGFATLALQVLWIRMFSQVLHNSVYTFSLIVVVFLVALSLGAYAGAVLSRANVSPRAVLLTILSAGAILVSASAIGFYHWTDGLRYLGGDAGFVRYVLDLFVSSGILIGVPVFVIGVLFPYLFHLAERQAGGVGFRVGRLTALNTLGAVAGSLAAGFFLLSWLGLWASVYLIAGVYLLLAFWIALDGANTAMFWRVQPFAALVLVMTVLNPSQLPAVRIDPVNRDETLLKVWEDSAGTVAVIRRNGHLRTKLNNWYTLGSSGALTWQRFQSQLPFVLHGEARSVFYLGLGTGITAGASLNFPVERVTVAENAPSVIRASAEFFADYTNGLFADERVTVHAEDGRNYLRGAADRFDLIISDLFIPWRAGVGNLYTVEHYAQSLSRLNDGGIYAQWIPLFQMTDEEFAIVARSMLEVFPQVTMWRRGFSADRPVVGLFGHQSADPLARDAPILATSAAAIEASISGDNDIIPLMSHYIGRLSVGDAFLAETALNTDNRPIIQYLAPRNHRLERAGEVSWFTGSELMDFMAQRIRSHPPAADPYVAEIDAAWRHIILAGYHLHLSVTLREQELRAESDEARQTYRTLKDSFARGHAPLVE